MDKADIVSALKPYLVGSEESDSGEWAMHCPLPTHDDKTRSASWNIEKGKWYCFACSEGGNIDALVRRLRGTSSKILNKDKALSFHRYIRKPAFKPELQEFLEARGLTFKTVRRFGIGYDPRTKCYTIPILDSEGQLRNIRRYWLASSRGGSKMVSIKGYSEPRLYPINQLEIPGPIIICEGELDALITIQHGFTAITRTGAADVWRSEWSYHFKDRDVYVIHDMDNKGHVANEKLLRELTGIAASVSVIELPYERVEKRGKDLTDFFKDGYTAADLRALMTEGGRSSEDVEEISVGESTAGGEIKRVRMVGTVVGRRHDTFLLPNEVEGVCVPGSMGDECETCPMMNSNGHARIVIPRDSPELPTFLFSGRDAINAKLRMMTGAPKKCPSLRTTIKSEHAVEKLYVRAPVDTMMQEDGGASGLVSNARPVYSVGQANTPSNSTIEMTGLSIPNPRTNVNEFWASTIHEVTTELDEYEMTPENYKLLKPFQAKRGRAVKKLKAIADDMADHVTMIYGRSDMHILFDLVFHSPLAFNFLGQAVPRGWLDVLVVGDTRTGKSEAATKMARHYKVGQIISCESSSLAGILGGVQQLGSGEWEITWGAIPYNDRRLVVLDEVSGLSREEISRMSSLRSSGVAEITKIRVDKIPARTRLIWLGNPREGSNHIYATHLIEDLIGNPEDIARFDIAMSVHRDDPGTDAANFETEDPGDPLFTREQYQNLIHWVWSRKPDQVQWDDNAESYVLECARDISTRYIETPPLVQRANIRIKIARVAAAVAARLFSCTDDGESILVTSEHVDVAVKLMDALYSRPRFGYREESRRRIEVRARAYSSYDEIKSFVSEKDGLAEFLRGSTGRFKTVELRDSLGLPDYSQATNMVAFLKKHGMLETTAENSFRITEPLSEILREL